MTQLMFYERPVPVSRTRHQKTRLAPVPGHYRFAARTNALPIASSEFGAASRDYPIVFVGAEGGPFNVAALVGLRDGENLMVDADGEWAAGTYVPAYARRYPFVLAKAGGSDGRLTVCIDEVCPGLGESDGQALFEADGKETPYLQHVLTFLKTFHGEAQRTADFANHLKSLGLLAPKLIQIQRQGQPRQALRGLWTVDPVRLRALDDARVVELFRSGHLAWIEAHLLSLGSLPRLIARLDAQSKVVEPESPVSAPAGLEETPLAGEPGAGNAVH